MAGFGARILGKVAVLCQPGSPQCNKYAAMALCAIRRRDSWHVHAAIDVQSLTRDIGRLR